MCVVCGNCIQYCHVMSCYAFYTLYIFLCITIFGEQKLWKKTGRFVISSYLYFDSYELHEIFQKYIGGVACCEYGINVCDSSSILC